MAKQYGQVDHSVFRQNCHETMAILAKEHSDMDVSLIMPYPDLLSLMRGSGRTFLTLFTQKGSSNDKNRTHTEQIFRMLKTVVVDESIFNQLVRKKVIKYTTTTLK